MRLAVGDPEATNYLPYCNGELLKRCFMADEEQGIAECYALDENGNYIFVDETKQELKTVTVRGKIELRRKEEV